MKVKRCSTRPGHTIIILAAAVISAGIWSCSSRNKNPRIVLDRSYKNEILEGRQALKMYLITSAVPGMSISVSIDGKTVWSEGMGVASKELQAPAKPETKYRIGGSSRMLTTFLIARLQQEGKLNVDSSFRSYIPDFPKKQWDFSVRQLGTHSAGFPEENNDLLFKQSKSYSTLKDYVRGLSGDSLLYKPDSYFMVSDYGSCLLGILAEEVTKKKFSALMQEMILDTLGLSETVLDNPLYIIDNRSQPYYQNYIAQMMNAPSVDLGFCAPSKGLLSTADDLNKAGRALLDTAFFSRKSLDLFLTPNKLGDYETNLGFGWWVVKDDNDRSFYAQMGSTIGGSSMLLVYPDTKLVVSICANASEEPGRFPGEQIAAIFLRKLDPRKEENVTNEASSEKNAGSASGSEKADQNNK